MKFSIIIDATPEKVWDVILGKDTYNLWTAPFAEGSSVKTDWKKGSKALFLDGKGHGMVSEIVENIPGKFLSIKHLGEIRNGMEDPTAYQTSDWGDALENYTLKEIDGKTEWTIDLDVLADYVGYMKETWPSALAIVKELAEKD